MDAGLLPVKRLEHAKSRLANILSDDQRHQLAEAMFEDALDLCRSSDFLRWWVVSDDPAVLDRAIEAGLDVIEDDGEGLNPALRRAVEVVAAAGAESVSIVPVDVPLAFHGDIRDLLDTGSTSDMVLVPSARDGGTNGFYMSPPQLVEPQFGRGSLHKHIAIAEERALRCAILTLDRLALDLDTLEDLRTFLDRPAHGTSATRAALGAMELPIGD